MSTLIKKLINKNIFNLSIMGMVVGLYFISCLFQLPMPLQLLGIATILLAFLKAR